MYDRRALIVIQLFEVRSRRHGENIAANCIFIHVSQLVLLPVRNELESQEKMRKVAAMNPHAVIRLPETEVTCRAHY